ncbi:XrtA/PEP-CTERM system TPR-repeat protein PrsT [Methylomonas sp. MK1]|uniref:XrtA/PEP-CTERM system TPR-repeat protein PrsT n=1 Tax=Methylomonas sp. MK1 TaxID=1131552 RepID=UPI000379F519|nr:XrtA/PEP-CTERM system TPR-repeat protein PrsT [Methylomonas sp. MK1]
MKPNFPLNKLLLILALNPVQISFADDIQAGKFYEEALQAYRSQNNAEAIINLKNALQQNERYVAAHLLLGDIYLQQKSLSAAEVELSLAKQLGADPSLLVENLAKLYTYQIRYKDLLKEIDPVLFATELRPVLHVYRGNAFLQTNLISEALNEFDIALQIAPNHIDAAIGRANALLKRGDIKGADQAAEKAMQIQPNDPGAWFVKGSIKHATMELDDALRFYDKAIELNPDHVDTRLARAGLLMDLKQDERARQDLEYLRKAYPFEPKAAYLHAVLLERNNQKESATKELEVAGDIISSIKPEYLSAHGPTLMLSGLVNYSLQRLDVAAEYLRQYVNQYPEQPGPYKLLATILLQKNEPEQAIDLLRPVQIRNPQDQRLALILGNAFMQVGKHDMANAMFEKAMKMGGGDSSLQAEIGFNRLFMGQEQAGLRDLEAAFKQNPDDTQAGIRLVALYITRGESEKALPVAKAMQDKVSRNLTLLNLLGMTQVSAKQFKEARQSFESTVEIDPAFLTGHLNLSKLDVAEKKFDDARNRLDTLLKKYPDEINVVTELATVEQAAGNYDKAIVLLERAQKLDQNALTPVLALVDVKLKTNKVLEALSLARTAERLNRNDPSVMEALLRCHLAANNKDEALAVTIRMAEQAKLNANNLFRAARYQIDLGSYNEAIKTLKRAVLVDENHIPSQVALVEMELNHGEAVFAVKRAETLQKQYPQQAFPHHLLGDIALRDKKPDLAADHFQSAFALEPNSIALMKLYSALKMSNQNQKAFTLLEGWIKKNPSDATPAAAYAEELLVAGKIKEAEKQYEKLLAITPDNPQFLNNLANIYFQTGNDKALSTAENAQKLAPDQASTNDTLGWILANQGQAERGLNYLRNAHSRQSQNPEIRYHIAFALDQLQRKEEAKQELEKALNANSNFPGIDQAKSLMEKLKK